MADKDISTSCSTNYGDILAKYESLWIEQLGRLKDRFSENIEKVEHPGMGQLPMGMNGKTGSKTDVPNVFVYKNAIVDVLSFLKLELGYGFLSDITASDEMPERPRFHVIYSLFSHTHFARIRIKVALNENETIETAVPVWAGANWAEREVFDMFGIRFEGHPDLRRILNDERFVGYPQRKDYGIQDYQIFSTAEPIRTELLE